MITRWTLRVHGRAEANDPAQACGMTIFLPEQNPPIKLRAPFQPIAKPAHAPILFGGLRTEQAYGTRTIRMATDITLRGSRHIFLIAELLPAARPLLEPGQ